MRQPKDTVALVTGANSGIGKAIATGLAKWGAHVTLVVRNRDKGAKAIEDIRRVAPNARLDLLVADLASQASIRAAAERFLQENKQLHILVNTAGVFLPDRVVTPDGLEATFATNVVAYYLLSELMLPALKKGAPARIVNVSSKYGGVKIPMDDLQTEKRKYSFLKSTPPTMLGRVVVTQDLAERLAATGVVANAVHPGLVRGTQLLLGVGGFFRWVTNRLGKTPEKGADTAVWLATAPEAEGVTGKLWHKRKPIKTPGQGSDPGLRKAFVARLAELTAASQRRASNGARRPATATVPR